jgi:parvulin-like peptidyl-prolyl isomerase
MISLLALVLMAASSEPSAVVVDRVAATVDDVAIPESTVRRAMVMSALKPGPGEAAEAFRQRVLEALIDQNLQYDDALRFGPVPPDAAEVSAAVERLRQRLKAEGRDPDKEFAAAGLSAEEVRATVERQLVVQRHLRERFRPVALADEERAREEYDRSYAPQRKAAGLPVPPFASVAEEMRARSQQRVFAEEVEKWMKELRQRARIEILRVPAPYPEHAKPVVLSTAPK